MYDIGSLLDIKMVWSSLGVLKNLVLREVSLMTDRLK